MPIRNEFDLSPECVKFALSSVGMGTWDIDLSTDTVQCSSEMLALWEIDPKAFTGERKILQSRVHPDDLEGMRKAIDKAVLEKTIYDLEYRIILPSGEKWVRSRGRCIFGDSPHEPVRFTGVVFDITQSKKKDQALNSAMKAKEDFLSQASHELRNPLTALSLLSKVFKSEVDSSVQGAEPREKFHAILRKQEIELQRIEVIIRMIFKKMDV